MMVTGTILFLLGTISSFTPTSASIPISVGTEIVITKNRSPNGDIKYISTSPEVSPFISNFVQKGTNIFVKPQLMLSSAHIPPTLQTLMFGKDCFKTPIMAPLLGSKVVIDEPIKVTETDLHINNLEAVVPGEIVEIKPSLELIPEPVVTLPMAPVIVEEIQDPKLLAEAEDKNYTKPSELVPISSELIIPIPIAPILPSFSMPEIPVPVVMELHEKETSLPALVEDTAATVAIPEAPELPPFTMPELPAPIVIEAHENEAPTPTSMEKTVIPVIIPETPAVPAFLMPELPAAVVIKAHENEVLAPALSEEMDAPVIVPDAPILPPFLMPQLPDPAIIESHNKEIPASALVEDIVTPVVIPKAPVLPPFSMPELPAPVIIESREKETTAPVLIEDIAPVVISEAPTLPAFLMAEFPAPVIIEAREKETQAPEESEVPIVIPEAPVLPPFSMPELSAPVIIRAHEKEISSPILFEELVPQPPIVVPEAPIFSNLLMPNLPAPIMIEAYEKETPVPTLVEDMATPLTIPKAPELPPFTMPELPASVVIKEAPASAIIEQAIVPVVIPEAPALPASSMPELSAPFMIESREKEVFAPVIVEEPVVTINIPEAPVLPPLSIVEPAVIEHFEEQENKKPNNIEKPLTFPAVPVLAPLEFPSMGDPLVPYPNIYTPEQILSSPYSPPWEPALSTLTPEKIEKADKIIVPTLPRGETRITIPAACAQNIIVERVLPNISGQQEIQVASALPSYPVPLPYLPTTVYRPF